MNWTDTTDGSTYQIYSIGGDGSATYIKSVNSDGSLGTISSTVTGLSKKTSYTFRVRATNSAGRVTSMSSSSSIVSMAGAGGLYTDISDPCDSGALASTCTISKSKFFGDNYQFSGANLTVASGGNIKTLNKTESIKFVMTGDITVQSGGAITANVNLAGSSDSAANFYVNSGGSVTATGLGYGGGIIYIAGTGPSPGGFVASRGGGGGAHGGTGGIGAATGGAGGTPAYGTAATPINGTKTHDYGSGGGGGGTTSTTCYGGDGGGILRIKVSGTIDISGTMSANGSAGTGGCATGGGGGAGGSIWLTAGTISGGGSLTANGGAGGSSTGTNGGGGGGGGRINIDYTTKTLSTTPTANGGAAGTSATAGNAGTYYQNGAL